jgi:hypothetical protein
VSSETSPRRSQGNSILLIDLENFYLAREHTSGTYRASELSSDLEELSRFLGDVAGSRRVTVRRAYANYNAARQASDVGRWDFFLQRAPKTLMECGIEPVQVFRFPGGGNKNAADMRLAMDASVLVAENDHIEQCVLVTGDADFIPLILELRRRGIEVVVIGVRGHTKMVLERYCDRFEYFEDLLVAADFEGGATPQIAALRKALHAILARHSPLPFAAVKPLLVKELGSAFEPTRFGCENTGEFLRSFAEELSIDIQGGATDWELRARSPHASAEQPAGAETPAERSVEPKPASASPVLDCTPHGAPHEHSSASYHKLLRYRRPNLHTLPREEWEQITATIFALSVDEGGARRDVEHQKLLDGATAICEPSGFEMTYHKVNGVLFQVFKSGCFVCSAEGPDKGRNEFHWGLTARLADGIDTLEELRLRLRKFLVDALKERLESVGVHTPIDVAVLAELLDGPTPQAETLEQLALLVQPPARVASAPLHASLPVFAADVY